MWHINTARCCLLRTLCAFLENKNKEKKKKLSLSGILFFCFFAFVPPIFVTSQWLCSRPAALGDLHFLLLLQLRLQTLAQLHFLFSFVPVLRQTDSKLIDLTIFCLLMSYKRVFCCIFHFPEFSLLSNLFHRSRSPSTDPDFRFTSALCGPVAHAQ